MPSYHRYYHISCLRETALSCILSAEGQKVLKIVELAQSAEDMLAVNKSVKSMVATITNLEIVLSNKISLFEECLCATCEVV